MRNDVPMVRNASIILGLLLLAGLVRCGNVADIDCSGETDPVCALDGVTYQNACFATQAGQFTFIEGRCPPIPCTQARVCGIDGTTYLSNCFAELNGVTTYITGDCPICNCTDIVECSGPVCGDNKTTYPTNCFAEQMGIAKYTPGACK